MIYSLIHCIITSGIITKFGIRFPDRVNRVVEKEYAVVTDTHNKGVIRVVQTCGTEDSHVRQKLVCRRTVNSRCSWRGCIRQMYKTPMRLTIESKTKISGRRRRIGRGREKGDDAEEINRGTFDEGGTSVISNRPIKRFLAWSKTRAYH